MKRPWMAPFMPLYAAGLALRNRRIENGSEQVRRLRFPVISIGNLSTGGSGKTPLTIALALALAGRGLRVDVLSRGYGRKSKLAARVNPNGTAKDFGDEPLQIARETGLPVYVASQRYDAGLLAESDARTNAPCPVILSDPECNEGESKDLLLAFWRKGREPRTTTPDEETPPSAVHLLDDGFQHRQLTRDVDILLLNQQDWQDTLLPAGNLREPHSAIHRASVIAIPADEPELEAELQSQGWQEPVWRLRRAMEIPTVSGPVAAFCGIARPEQFFAGLESASLHLALRKAFPDHHRYTVRDLDRLVATAHAAGATALLTTEKDLIRLGMLATTFPQSLPLKTARLRIEIESQAAAIDWLINRLGASPPHPPL